MKTTQATSISPGRQREERYIAAGFDSGSNSCIRRPVDLQSFVRSAEQLVTYWLRLNEAPPLPMIR